MKSVITTEKAPIKLWLDDIEDGALQQAKNLANLPFVFKHIAIMPDSHQGYGMPIGGVMATTGVIVPNAVGVDIGCGMCAVKTSLEEITKDDIKKIFGGSKENQGGIMSSVPVGFSHHSKMQDWDGFDKAPDIDIIQKELESSKKQLGTLGGGNHFIEIQKGSDGFVWIMLHSGSRNFGLKIADQYHKAAKFVCEKYYSDIPVSDLSFLPIDSDTGKEYFDAMNFALEFAKESRMRMIVKIKEAFDAILRGTSYGNIINVHHNYAALENHFGKNVIVHRKGATSARDGQLGLIPGSQGTKSYVVRGRGNEESFMSCSHGAGRKMGRKQAQRELSLEEQQDILNKQGIVHSIRNAKDLDEAPGAYKDISVVMRNQKDLVDIEVELSPLAVIKA